VGGGLSRQQGVIRLYLSHPQREAIRAGIPNAEEGDARRHERDEGARGQRLARRSA